MRSFSVVALAVVVAALAVGCGSSTEEAAPPPATVPASPSAEATRKAAPALAGVSLDGVAIALGDFRGRPVLINVWSSW